jgi:hypothetical protein
MGDVPVYASKHVDVDALRHTLPGCDKVHEEHVVVIWATVSDLPEQELPPSFLRLFERMNEGRCER